MRTTFQTQIARSCAFPRVAAWQAGQYVALRAEMDIVLVMSACPQDVTAVNGMAPADAHYSIG